MFSFTPGEVRILSKPQKLCRHTPLRQPGRIPWLLEEASSQPKAPFQMKPPEGASAEVRAIRTPSLRRSALHEVLVGCKEGEGVLGRKTVGM